MNEMIGAHMNMAYTIHLVDFSHVKGYVGSPKLGVLISGPAEKLQSALILSKEFLASVRQLLHQSDIFLKCKCSR